MDPFGPLGLLGDLGMLLHGCLLFGSRQIPEHLGEWLKIYRKARGEYEAMEVKPMGLLSWCLERM